MLSAVEGLQVVYPQFHYVVVPISVVVIVILFAVQVRGTGQIGRVFGPVMCVWFVVLAAFGAALAGALWLATAITFQPKTYFSVQWTAYMIFMALVGGLGTFEGPILGAVLFFAIETWFGDAGVWYLVGLGTTALLFSLFLPHGLWGWFESRTGLHLLFVGHLVRLPAPVVPVP